MTQIPEQFQGYLYYILSTYPTAFKHPITVLTHLFFSVGGGYAYVHDEIVVDAVQGAPKSLLDYEKPDSPYAIAEDDLVSQLAQEKKRLETMNSKWFKDTDSNPNISLLRIGDIPYPYCMVHHLNTNSKPWLLQLAFRTTQAWMRFLASEINANSFRNAYFSNKHDTVEQFFVLKTLRSRIAIGLRAHDIESLGKVKRISITV